MPIPTVITDLSQTAASNYPSGSDSPATLDDTQRAHGSFIAQLRDGKGFTNPVVMASATTTDIGGQNSQFVEISGTTTITSLGTTYNGPRFLRFQGILTLTHNSTTLNIPGSANVTTAAGDVCIAVPNQAQNGWNISNYSKASGTPLGAAASGANTDISALNFAGGVTTATQAATDSTTKVATTAFVQGELTSQSVKLTGNQTIAGVKTFSSMPVVPTQSMIRLNTANGYGSTNTNIRRFTTTVVSQGTDITYADSATLGASFTINANGVYSITFQDNFNTANSEYGVSLNTASPTTGITAQPATARLVASQSYAVNATVNCSVTVFLSAGDVIRAHTGANVSGVASAAQFSITRVG